MKPKIEWHKDFRLRCKYDQAWVDFFFEVGGGDKELGIERRPFAISENAQSELCETALADLTAHLNSIGYRVTIIE